jgi:hypothetical protein
MGRLKELFEKSISNNLYKTEPCEIKLPSSVFLLHTNPIDKLVQKRKENNMSNKKQSGNQMASLASKVLKSNSASNVSKKLAGSVLSQAKGKK